MAKKTLLITDIKRESNKLYWCGTSEEGYITVGESEMARGNKKKEDKAKNKK